MKKIFCAFMLLGLIWGCTHVPKQEYSSFEQEKFKNPDNTFRSVPFYSLNDSLSEEELIRQLKLMKEGGFGGAFLHSRIGLLTPYLSEEWFHMMEVGVKACQDLEMDAWFYDEDKWPSGFAGGIVPLQSEAYRSRTLIRIHKDTKVDEGDTVLYEDSAYKYVCQVGKMGQPWFNGTCWVDLMNPEMVKAFIECSYQPYIERFAGKPFVKGMFTDEPQISPRVTGEAGSVSYSPYMDAAFEKLWGYKLYPVLPSLFDEVGDWRTVRLHYYRTVAYCMEQAFSKQIADYCEENGFIWTGHYNGENVPASTMDNEGNLSQQLRHMQMPGIDALGLRYNTIHNAKVNTSTANQYGIPRRLTELFGISGHNMSFEDRMWIPSWHTIMGVNFMCPHLYLYSMKGERKRDYPPTVSHHQPYWSQNKLFEDYSARLCYFATVGSPKAEVCVLSPLESDYMDITPRGVKSTRKVTWDQQQEAILKQLMGLQSNSDMGDEQIISEIGMVEDGCFKVGKMAYRIVIVPPMRTIRPSTLNLLKAFAQAGGTVLVYDNYPELVEGKLDTQAIEQLKASSILVTAETLKAEIEKVYTPVFFLEGTNKHLIWSHLREVEDGQVLQLSNTSRLQNVKVNVRVSDPKNKVALWNPVNGECLQINPDKNGLYTLDFAPAQTWILTFGKPSVQAIYDKVYNVSGERTSVVTLTNKWKNKKLNANAIPLDFAAWSTDGGKTWNDPEPVLAIYYRFSEKKAYDGPLHLRYSFQVNQMPKACDLAVEQPWIYKGIQVNGTSVSIGKEDIFIDHTICKTSILSLLKPGKNEVILSVDNISARPASLDAVERYGTEIETIYLVGDFGVQGSLSKEQPTASWRNRDKNLEPRPLPTRFLYKSFELVDEPAIVEGDLVREGYPFFAGRMELEQDFKIEKVDKKTLKYILRFNNLETILVSVRLNGKEFPVIFSSPWECDITEALQEGSNQLVVTLTNSLRNLMGPYHHVGAEFAQVGPAVFRGNHSWPNLEPGDRDWFDARIRGNAILWRDDYYSIPFGLLASPIIETEKVKE